MTRLLAFVLRDARVAATYPMSLVMPFASIAVTVAGFAFLATIVDRRVTLEHGSHLDYFSYVIVNLAFMLLFNQALQCVAQAIRRDQLAGTMESIVATTTTIPEILTGSSLWTLGMAVVQVAVYFAVAYGFGMRLTSVDGAGLIAVVLLSTVVMVGIGILIGAFVLRYKQSPPSSLLTGGAAALLTGVLFPVALLPQPLQVLSWLLPLTHALHGIRLSLSGDSLQMLVPDLVWLAVFGALVVPASLVAFASALRRARIEGTLSTY